MASLTLGCLRRFIHSASLFYQVWWCVDVVVYLFLFPYFILIYLCEPTSTGISSK